MAMLIYFLFYLFLSDDANAFRVDKKTSNEKETFKPDDKFHVGRCLRLHTWSLRAPGFILLPFHGEKEFATRANTFSLLFFSSRMHPIKIN